MRRRRERRRGESVPTCETYLEPEQYAEVAEAIGRECDVRGDGEIAISVHDWQIRKFEIDDILTLDQLGPPGVIAQSA